MKDYRDLQVWHRAHKLNLAVYRDTGGFPKDEWYGLRSQIRRCSGSVPANIAERHGDGDFYRFLDIASGSASELDDHLMVARDLRYMEEQAYRTLSRELTEIRRMLTGLLRKVGKDRGLAKR